VRTIGVVTVARSDYGIYRPILRQIQADSDLKLMLFVGGMHLSPEYGLTVRNIEQDGFAIAERVEMLLASDTPEAISKAMGLGLIGFAQAYTRSRPDILLVLGDRFEMFAAAAAAMPFHIPLAHLHGGESTEGQIDEAIRHSLTKMSHLHFVSAPPYAARVIQLGEAPWRVTVSGAPSLDNLADLPLMSQAETERQLGLALDPAPLLVTFHPVTLEYEKTSDHIAELLAALDATQLPVLFTYPNADTSGRIIIAAIEQFVNTHANARAAVSLGTPLYFSLLQYVRAMVGNSSSGIIEAASFALPVINVGLRQKGRFHAQNVIDVPCDRDAIGVAIGRAANDEFRHSLRGMTNPYGEGQAAAKIVRVLKETHLGPELLLKHFYDLSPAAAQTDSAPQTPEC
jgi:UDP-hydrolysing UDP-N-acetyl-D-glucosamine 2-epimerase